MQSFMGLYFNKVPISYIMSPLTLKLAGYFATHIQARWGGGGGGRSLYVPNYMLIGCIVSKVDGRSPIVPSPLFKCSCNYFLFEASGDTCIYFLMREFPLVFSKQVCSAMSKL